MKITDDSDSSEWRARLHSLPSDPAAVSPVVSWCLRAFLSLGLFLVGSVFVLMAGAYVGFSHGIGPEQTGGALYVLLGLILNLFAGAAIAAFVARRSTSLSTPRVVFYSFTAPAFLAVVLLALSFAKYLFQ
jgi:hypothetical protein